MGECKHGPTCPQVTGSSHKTRPSRLPHGASTAIHERAEAKEMTAKIRGRSQKPRLKLAVEEDVRPYPVERSSIDILNQTKHFPP